MHCALDTTSSIYFLHYFRPHTLVFSNAPPCIFLSLTFFLLSRNTLNPSNSLIWVLVRGLPPRFKSTIAVFVKSVAGIGWGLDSVKCVLVTWMWLFLRERAFSFLSWPISFGRDTITLLSRFNSVRDTNLHISGGMAAILLKDKSNFSREIEAQICLGIVDKAFPLIDNRFTFIGKSGKVPVELFSRFFPKDRDCSFDSLEIGDSDVIVTWFSSQLNDFNSFSCESLPRFCILFFDTSSVRRVVILLNAGV